MKGTARRPCAAIESYLVIHSMETLGAIPMRNNFKPGTLTCSCHLQAAATRRTLRDCVQIKMNYYKCEMKSRGTDPRFSICQW